MPTTELPIDTVESAAGASPEDRRLIADLRHGDEAAFLSLVERHHGSLVRLALSYVPDRAVAEEVAQETWIAVMRGLDRFEGRSSLKNWIFRILINRSKSRGKREARSVPFSSLAHADDEGAEHALEAERFDPVTGHWVSPPGDWGGSPEESLLSSETRARIQEAIDALPAGQRDVITLRDVEGWSAEEVCDTLGISAANQRVLLHRARARVRHTLEPYLAEA